jgi:PIN domain nuclease of toxin-antitoxin system
MTDMVVDSSAVLAELKGEPGGETVRALTGVAHLSAVNYCEVITKLIEAGIPADEAAALAEALGYAVAPADQQRAAMAGKLHAKTRGTGVSLGDRFCLALAQELALPVLTSDRRWATLDIGVEIILIR